MNVRSLSAVLKLSGLAAALSGCTMAAPPQTAPQPAADVLRQAEAHAYAAGYADGKRAQLLHDRKLGNLAVVPPPVRAAGAAAPVAKPAVTPVPPSAAAAAAVAAGVTPPLASYSSVGPAKALGSAAPF